MSALSYTQIEGKSSSYWLLLGLLLAMMVAGFGAAMYMEHAGHVVTGMNNRIVWGMPHVFAVYLIIAASGALNVASIASVFNKAIYRPLAPLSALLAIALLAGGLSVLVLDLGRPDRLIVAMTYFNAKSIFAWNQLLYSGFFLIVGIYLWFMLEKKMYQYIKIAAILAFTWRLILTTGTGCIFGFLVAREAYDAAMIAPLFVAMSFAAGLAIYLSVLIVSYRLTGRDLGEVILFRLKNLLAIFISVVLYFVVVYHLSNLYVAEHHGVEAFILWGENGGGVYAIVFWCLQIGLGTIVPLIILYSRLSSNRNLILLAAVWVVIGGLAQLYVVIIGGQAYPLEIFPGMQIIEGHFVDTAFVNYSASVPEVVLGLGMGFGLAFFVVVVGIGILGLLPRSLSDEVLAQSVSQSSL